MTGIQAKRRFIVIALLCVALGGALLRLLSEPGSTARDIGTLLMLLWLPIIGNVIAWLIAKLRRPVAAEPAGFEAGSTFHPHALVELTLRAPQLPSEDSPIPEGEHRCAAELDVVSTPAVSKRSLIAIGMPCSGPRYPPAAISDSAIAASSRAAPAVTVTKADRCGSTRSR